MSKYDHISDRQRVLLGLPTRQQEIHLSAWVVLANSVDDNGERLRPTAGEELPAHRIVGAISRSAGIRGRRSRSAARQDVTPNFKRQIRATTGKWAVS